MDGNKGAGKEQTDHYLGSFLELKGENIKADRYPDQDLGYEKIGHQR
jgi:hypothetical protein